jgi:putative transposase
MLYAVQCGYYLRDLFTRVGRLTLRVPLDREGRFSTEIFERYQRSEKALVLALQESYLQGVSTRKVKKITEKLCGVRFSKDQVSSMAQELDEELGAWRSRALEMDYPYLVVDAHYEYVREDGQVESDGVLQVKGVREDGYREILSVFVSPTEEEATWSEVFADPRRRGLRPPVAGVADGNPGLWAALRDVYPETQDQRCWVHRIRNVLDKLPERLQARAKSMLHEIMKSPDRESAEEEIERFVAEFEARYPNATDCLQKDRWALLRSYDFPAEHWRHL